MNARSTGFAAVLVAVATCAGAGDFVASNEATLDAALAAAVSPGDTITVTADITVTGAKTLAAAGVTLRGGAGGPFRISGTGINEPGLDGMVRVAGAGCTVQDLGFTNGAGAEPGLRVTLAVTGDDVMLQRCDLQAGNAAGGGVGLAVFLPSDEVTGFTVSDCTFSDSKQFINLQDQNDDILIQNCTFGPVDTSGFSIVDMPIATYGGLGTSSVTIADCHFEEGYVYLNAAPDAPSVIRDCVFAGKQRANRALLFLDTIGDVRLERCLIYDTVGDGTGTGSYAVRVGNLSSGTVTLDRCTIVHQDSQPSAALFVQAGGLAVVNSIVHLTQAGQVGVARTGGTATVNFSNIYTPAGAAQTSGTVGGGTGLINADDLRHAAGDDPAGDHFLLDTASVPSFKASSTGGIIGYSDRVATPPCPDTDLDGLCNSVEVGNADAGLPGTVAGNEWLLDSDGDGLPDNREDADRDGAQGPGETAVRDRDSDDDQVEDGVEVALSRDPLAADAGFADADHDGLPDGVDPFVGRDQDGDRFDDGFEAGWFQDLAAAGDAQRKPPVGDANGDGFFSNLDALVAQSLFLTNIDTSSPVFNQGRPYHDGFRYLDLNRDGAISNIDALVTQSFFLENLAYLPLR